VLSAPLNVNCMYLSSLYVFSRPITGNINRLTLGPSTHLFRLQFKITARVCLTLNLMVSKIIKRAGKYFGHKYVGKNCVGIKMVLEKNCVILKCVGHKLVTHNFVGQIRCWT
jgi:hypothetical protein